MKTIPKLFALALILTACSGIQVTSDYDKTVDFNKYKTYSFYSWEQKSDQLLSRFDKERIENSVGEELESRSLKYVESGGDLTVSLFVVMEQKTSRTAYTDHYGGGGYYDYDAPWGWGMGHSTTTYQESDYIVGTLVIDLFDAGTKKLIWQGVGSGTVDEDPQRRANKLPQEIGQIFYKFPKEKIKE